MKRSNLVGNVVQAQGEMDILYPNGYSYEDLAKHIVDKIHKTLQEDEERDSIIEKLYQFEKTIPTNASYYHRLDMLISKADRIRYKS